MALSFFDIFVYHNDIQCIPKMQYEIINSIYKSVSLIYRK